MAFKRSPVRSRYPPLTYDNRPVAIPRGGSQLRRGFSKAVGHLARGVEGAAHAATLLSPLQPQALGIAADLPAHPPAGALALPWAHSAQHAPPKRDSASASRRATSCLAPATLSFSANPATGSRATHPQSGLGVPPMALASPWATSERAQAQRSPVLDSRAPSATRPRATPPSALSPARRPLRRRV